MPDAGVHCMWCEWQPGNLFNLEIYNAISKLTNITVQWATYLCVLNWYFDVCVISEEEHDCKERVNIESKELWLATLSSKKKQTER